MVHVLLRWYAPLHQQQEQASANPQGLPGNGRSVPTITEYRFHPNLFHQSTASRVLASQYPVRSFVHFPCHAFVQNRAPNEANCSQSAVFLANGLRSQKARSHALLRPKGDLIALQLPAVHRVYNNRDANLKQSAIVMVPIKVPCALSLQ